MLEEMLENMLKDVAVPSNFTEFLFWLFDLGFDVIGVFVIIWMLVFFIPRRDTLYLNTMKEDMEDRRETIKVLHQEVESSRDIMTGHMSEHNKTQTKLLSDCVTLMQNLVAKTQQQENQANALTGHMAKHDTTQTMLLKECVDLMANLAAKMEKKSETVSR